jgi:hypothetical protein
LNSATNETKTVYVQFKDSVGNVSSQYNDTIVLDTGAPTVIFSQNGNGTYAKSQSTAVTVSDSGAGINASSLKYQWTTNTTAPEKVSFTTGFINGETITKNDGDGSFYLWILAKDNAENTTITKSNVFNIDNTAPIITVNGNSTGRVLQNSGYTELGAIWNDNLDGTGTIPTATSGSVNTAVTGVYVLEYSYIDRGGNT